jgi:hypothetical protein
MMKLNIDILLSITDYLNDKDSMSLFSVNKSVKDISRNSKYTIKKSINHNQILSIPKNYRITSISRVYLDMMKYIEKNQDRFVFVKTLWLDDFCEPIKIFPKNLEKVFDINHSIDKLPFGIKEIWFGDCFNEPIDNLPDSVTLIHFGLKFNQDINKLPKYLNEISFSINFNSNITYFPDGLEYISFEYCSDFDKPLPRFPDSVKKIVLSERFDHRLVNLPYFLREITFGWHFRQCLKFLREMVENELLPYLEEVHFKRYHVDFYEFEELFLKRDIKIFIENDGVEYDF